MKMIINYNPNPQDLYTGMYIFVVLKHCTYSKSFHFLIQNLLLVLRFMRNQTDYLQPNSS